MASSPRPGFAKLGGTVRRSLPAGCDCDHKASDEVEGSRGKRRLDGVGEIPTRMQKDGEQDGSGPPTDEREHKPNEEYQRHA